MALQVSFQVSAYPDCARELIEFRNLNRHIPRDSGYFDWRYLARPCAQAPIIVWAESAGERVGALTIFPHDYYVLDGEYPVAVLGDISVRAEHRGSGIAGAMFRFLPQIEAVRCLRGALVLPNEQAARSLGKSGWREIHRVERFVKMLDFRPRLAARIGARFAGALAAPMNRLARGLTYESFYRNRRYRTELVRSIDDGFDELWRRADKHGKVIGLRDARYLRWRYQRHPANTYCMLSVSAGEALCGYAMYRLVGDTCYVDDVFCLETRRDAVHVVGLLVAHVREHESVSAISVSINRSVLHFPWRRFGFIGRADYQRLMTSGDSPSHGGLHDIPASRWHLTGGDKDV